jgi:ketosteroid isomerase-like protein
MPPQPFLSRSGKHILEVGVFTPGNLAYEVTALADVDVRADGDTTEFSGHATIKSRFKGRDFSSLYRLSRVYEVRQGRWRIIASRTARLGDE